MNCHEDRRAAAGANHHNYQQQWLAQVNQGVIDQTYYVGQLVLMQVIGNTGHKALARQLDKQKVLIMKTCPYSKYKIYTPHGLLKDTVHANVLSPTTPNYIRPATLQLDELQIAVY